MKKYIYALAGLVLTISACKKTELDLFPFNQIETTQAFNTQADVTLAVNGMYQGIRASGSYYNGTWNIFADATADNIITNQAGRGSFRTFAEWRYTASNTYGLFSGGYTIIRRANAILENIDKFPAGAFHDDAKGQALAMRALVHFDISRVYSKTYLNATSTDSITPFITSTDPTITPKKELVTTFYDKIIADLNAAIPLIADLNVQVPSVKNLNVIRLTKVSTNAILSRVLLYKGDYAGTITAANAAISVQASTKEVSLVNFPKIWTDETDSGVLFKIRNTVIDNSNTQGVNYFQTVGGLIKSEFLPTFPFYQLYTSTDVRKPTYFLTSLFNGVNYNNIIKYRGRPGGVDGVVDAKVIRTAEVLLNRMEAYYRSGNQTAALADLRILKAARYAGYVNETLAGQALLDEILLQRRLELAFEGDRLFTLKRLNLPVVRDATFGERADGTGTPFVFLTLAAGDYRFQIPYPELEIAVNGNFGGNNPGY